MHAFLFDLDGVLIDDPALTMKFRIYDAPAPGGALLWEEEQAEAPPPEEKDSAGILNPLKCFLEA